MAVSVVVIGASAVLAATPRLLVWAGVGVAWIVGIVLVARSSRVGLGLTPAVRWSSVKEALMRSLPIGDDALVSDCRSAALSAGAGRWTGCASPALTGRACSLTGVAVLTDALAVGRNDRGHELGVEYAPRPEYGLIHPILTPVDGGLAARGGADVLVLSAPVALVVEAATATGRFTLRAGESAAFALAHSVWVGWVRPSP
jgi:hypothetical protein